MSARAVHHPQSRRAKCCSSACPFPARRSGARSFQQAVRQTDRQTDLDGRADAGGAADAERGPFAIMTFQPSFDILKPDSALASILKRLLARARASVAHPD